MDGISDERWKKAQQFESLYWQSLNVEELLRICAEKPAFLSLLGEPVVSRLLEGRRVLEIGVGAAGISLASLSKSKSKIARLVKVEPLAVIEFGKELPRIEPWAAGFIEWAAGLAREGELRQQKGEDLHDIGEFDTVICYNVLDHVQDPCSVVAAAFQALRPGGEFLVGVDCLSVLGRLRFEQFTRRRMPGSVLVEAHPHSFLPQHVVAMLRDKGFISVECFGLKGRIGWFAGSHYRPAFVARKPE